MKKQQQEIKELYFELAEDFKEWLAINYDSHSKGVYLIFYKLEANIPTMRWEEAVKVALCYGWIDSTVKNLGGPKRRQFFCRRKPKSVWSRVNKNHIKVLEKEGLMHAAGRASIKIAKENGSWAALDDVENLVIPADLDLAFKTNTDAFTNYSNFAAGYRKSYLYWLNQAKRDETRQKRIKAIIEYCEANIKSRGNW
jgi:uncharacterized protein YdeI (YjbR/CyaY-like superfamily)